MTKIEEAERAYHKAINWANDARNRAIDKAWHVFFLVDCETEKVLSKAELQALKDYNRTVAQAEDYYKGKIQGSKGYEGAIAQAEKTYEEAETGVRKDYYQAKTKADKDYKEAVAQVEKDCKEAKFQALKDYREAIGRPLPKDMTSELLELERAGEIINRLPHLG